jgi:predicted nucleic acid-binding protein
VSVFLDSNVAMYAAGAAHAHKEPSLRLLQQAHDKSIELVTSTEVLQEILHRYHRLGRPDVAAEVYHLITDLCLAILPVTLADTDAAVRLLAQHRSSVRDALHVAVMASHGVPTVATFDTGFDAFPQVSRLVPQ